MAASTSSRLTAGLVTQHFGSGGTPAVSKNEREFTPSTPRVTGVQRPRKLSGADIRPPSYSTSRMYRPCCAGSHMDISQYQPTSTAKLSIDNLSIPKTNVWDRLYDARKPYIPRESTTNDTKHLGTVKSKAAMNEVKTSPASKKVPRKSVDSTTPVWERLYGLRKPADQLRQRTPTMRKSRSFTCEHKKSVGEVQSQNKPKSKSPNRMYSRSMSVSDCDEKKKNTASTSARRGPGKTGALGLKANSTSNISKTSNFPSIKDKCSVSTNVTPSDSLVVFPSTSQISDTTSAYSSATEISRLSNKTEEPSMSPPGESEVIPHILERDPWYALNPTSSFAPVAEKSNFSNGGSLMSSQAWGMSNQTLDDLLEEDETTSSSGSESLENLLSEETVAKLLYDKYIISDQNKQALKENRKYDPLRDGLVSYAENYKTLTDDDLLTNN